MSTLGTILLDKEILLESGTNELELLVFEVADFLFGINVAKVREVLPAQEITHLPHAHPSIRGVFKLRNQVIPCVSLLTHLGIKSTAARPESTMILADFNQQQTAFLVDAVDRIYRLSWEDILAVPGLTALAHTPVTALARCEGRLVVMLDFEMVLDDVTERFYRLDGVENPLDLPRERLRILLAEDSPTVRDAIGTTLRASGYTQLTFCENGAEAWTWIEKRLAETGRAEDVADLVISDVEMPQVDGFHLTRRIKQHPQLADIPVLLYSSIVTPDNQKKGRAVGADAQVSKPELNKVVELADELIAASRRESRPRPEGKRLCDTRKAPTTPGTDTPHVGDRRGHGVQPSLTATAGPETAAGSEEPEGDELPSLRDIDPRLWRTFQSELEGHVVRLKALLAEADTGDRSGRVVNQTLRALHTVKSAAMVLPLEPVSHRTHEMESRVAAAKADPAAWPRDALLHYADWLARVAELGDES